MHSYTSVGVARAHIGIGSKHCALVVIALFLISQDLNLIPGALMINVIVKNPFISVIMDSSCLKLSCNVAAVRVYSFY